LDEDGVAANVSGGEGEGLLSRLLGFGLLVEGSTMDFALSRVDCFCRNFGSLDV